MGSSSSRWQFKVSVIGDYAVGKTSLIQRYMTNTFSEDYKATIGAAISTFDTEVHNTKVSLQVWDLAGQTTFRRVRAQYLFGTDFALVVFDLTRPETLESVKEWVADLRSAVPDAFCFLVGNKSDLVEERAVTAEEAQAMADQLKMVGYMETSAKDGSNVRELFTTIARVLLEQNRPTAPST